MSQAISGCLRTVSGNTGCLGYLRLSGFSRALLGLSQSSLPVWDCIGLPRPLCDWLWLSWGCLRLSRAVPGLSWSAWALSGFLGPVSGLSGADLELPGVLSA